MRRHVIISIAGLLLLPTAVLATLPAEARTTWVSFADLDLRFVVGQQTLDRRLVRAAHSVCSPTEETNLSAMGRERRCVQATLADARAQLGEAVALAQAGRPATMVALASR